MESDSVDSSPGSPGSPGSLNRYEPSEGKDYFKQTLVDCINRIKATGFFATGGGFYSCPIPGIRVDGREPIAVPLSEEAARNLARHEETPVDGTVRKTLQISAERISFQNSEWDGFVNRLAQQVARELGVPPAPNGSNVRAELYEHILYEPGAMFKPQKDTEKNPGMFGTLVICLPSKHTGGTVYLQHGKDSLKLFTAETSEYCYHYLAWYADVNHEIKPVDTGYRWMLVYNLIVDDESARPSASALASQTQDLVKALSLWQTLPSPPDFLVYPLGHQYTPNTLSLFSLKGLDHQRACYVADGCKRNGELVPLLATMTRRISGDGGESASTQRLFLDHVCSLKGFELTPLCVDIDETALLKDISYERDPYLRNGEKSIGCSHEDMVLVIVRADSLHALLFDQQDPSDVNVVMKHLREGFNDRTKAAVQNVLVHLCRKILDQKFAVGEENDQYLGWAAVSAAFMGNWLLVEKARKQTVGSWDSDTWSELGGLIDLQCSLFEPDGIFETLVKRGTLSGICEDLTRFYKGFCAHGTDRRSPEKVEYWKKWYTDRLIKTLDMFRTFENEDIYTIRDIISDDDIHYTPEQRTKVDEALRNLVVRVKNDKGFVNLLNIQLLVELSDPQNDRKEFLRDLFSVISDSAISNFDIELYIHSDRVIREFYKQALVHKENSASNLLRKISDQAAQVVNPLRLGNLWPLIEQVLPSAGTGPRELQTCFQLLVETYITRTVGKEPSKPEDWARPMEVHNNCKCGCENVFLELNRFLKDPSTKGKTMTLTADEQKDLPWRFPFVDIWPSGREGEVRLTKTLKGWERRHRVWERNVRAARGNLQELPKDARKRALGDKYDTIMALLPHQDRPGHVPEEAQPELDRDEDADWYTESESDEEVAY